MSERRRTSTSKRKTSSKSRGKPARKRSNSAASRQREREVKSKARTRKKTRRNKKSTKRNWLTGRNIRLALNAGLTLAILGMLAMAYYMHDLPDISKLTQVTKAPSIIIRAENGDLIGSSGDIYGEYLPYEAIPRHLVKAVVATEDRSFFRHWGVDPFGLLRATVANIRAGRIVQGGSTITQQLAKNIFLTPERSLKRKIQEVFIAFGMEYRYSKTEILSVYLNRVYFGAGTYGIDAAARRYFGKSARDLYLPESAMIAGLLKAPSRYAPTNNPDLAKRRATQVLINMEDAGLISEDQLAAARKTYETIKFAKLASTSDTRYFNDWVMDQLPNYVGTIHGDLIVTTTFNANLQRKAEAAVDKILTDEVMENYDLSQVALVSMEPSGAVRAMIGGRDYGKSQYNRAEQARRQPGSAFKAFVYLAAMESGFLPDDFIADEPIEIDGWRPSNYDGRYHGETTLKEAFAKSYNTVAVSLSEQVGRDRVIAAARRLGLQAEMDPIPSLALGVTETSVLEMTNAYAHFASGGRLVLPYAILEIQDLHGNLIFKYQPPRKVELIRPRVVARMNDMLLSVVEEGTGRGASIGRPAAGKTGTSQDFRDAWFVGYTPELVTGVWVGNDDNAPMQKVTGGKFPAQIWGAYMGNALSNVSEKSMPRSSGGWLERSGRAVRRGVGGGTQNFWDDIFDLDLGGGEPSERPERPNRIRR